MNEQEDLSIGSMSGIESERKRRASSRRARAKATLARQRIRTAEGLVRAFGKVKSVSGRVKSACKMKCPVCDRRVAKETKFCPGCGADISSSLTVKPQVEATVKKPILMQRVAAQLIDRLLPLPFLVLVYPKWFWVVGAFHLICEMWAGRSPGKMICRMRVVDAGSLKACGPVRGVIRRIGVALGQVAYCRWEWVPLAVAYDLVSFLFVWRNRQGRRIEDLLFGTRVIGEGRYRKLKRQCGRCGAMVSARVRFCSQCGGKTEI